MVLLYKAATDQGKIVRGFIEAKDMKEAASYLRNHQLYPITITEQKDNPLQAFMPLNRKFTFTDLVFFTRQIASMLTSGLTLMQALQVLREQISKKAVSDVLNEITRDIEGGKTFSDALQIHSRVFSQIYISLVKAGESSGLLDKVMTHLAENLEKQEKLKTQIKSALLYPVIVISMMIVVVFIMMLFVIPQLSTLYDSLAIELPITTRILVGMSNFTIHFWPIIIGAGIGSVMLFRRWHSTKVGRRAIDRSLLRVPLFGRIIRLSLLTEFTRTFGLLVGAGEPIVSSISQAKDVTGNVLYTDGLGRIASQVEKGVPIGDAFNATTLFPPLLIQMIRVGEQTGKLDENLMRASDYFQREVEQSIRTLTTAMEPFIMAVLGIGVAFLLIAVITPIYQLTQGF